MVILFWIVLEVTEYSKTSDSPTENYNDCNNIKTNKKIKKIPVLIAHQFFIFH